MSRSSLPRVLSRLSPGSPLRDAIELIVRQGTGALIVVGWGSKVKALCSGGFQLEGAPFTPARIAELAKMDGAIVVDDDIRFILRANVHLTPAASIPTVETGTRQRTAERMSRQTGKPVIAVSIPRGLAILYCGNDRHQLKTEAEAIAATVQAVADLDRLRLRLDEAEALLERAELEDTVRVRTVVTLLQRAAMLLRLQAEVEEMAAGMGPSGREYAMQAADLCEGVPQAIELLISDYGRALRVGRGGERLASIPTEGLYDADRVAAAIGLGPLDDSVRPVGLRLLGRVPRLPDQVRIALAQHFGDVRKLLTAGIDELAQVEGVGETRAAQLRSHFDRFAGWDLGSHR